MKKEFKKRVKLTQRISGISGSYTKICFDHNNDFDKSSEREIRPAFTYDEYEKMIKEAYKELSTRKKKYYVFNTGDIDIKVISHKDHPNITKFDFFHQFDFIEYDGITRNIEVEVTISMELCSMKKERGKKLNQYTRRNDFYFSEIFG